MANRKITDEQYAAIPGLLKQGMTRVQLAAAFNTTVESLQSLCSMRDITLRKGGVRWEQKWTKDNAGHKYPQLRLSGQIISALQKKAGALGVSEQQLLHRILHVIQRDDLFDSILDGDDRKFHYPHPRAQAKEKKEIAA